MNSLKISTRLSVLVCVLIVLLIVQGVIGLFGINRANEALQHVYEDRTVPIGQLGEIRALLLGNRIAITAALATPSPAILASSIATLETNVVLITKTWDAYMATTLTAEEKVLAATFAAARAAFVKEGILPALAALRTGDMDRVQRIIEEKIRTLWPPVKSSVDQLVKLQIDVANEEYSHANERYGVIRTVSIVTIFLGLLFAGGFGFVLIRSINRQLGAEPGDAVRLAQSVAAGDLSGRVALKSGDSSSLMAQLHLMQASLVGVVAKVRQGAEGVATASAEIAQGNHDLSSRTEQQASALQETAASMEQLSATVRQNADGAKQANQLAVNASTVAAKGGEVVGQVVETMKDINESSRKISDIIQVIDGIAFQTNILALNAAVEAARAGEQGRGFAVVASEVRSLAGRSAEAAKEIKSLINASVARVDHGSALVDKAGATMTEVVVSIRRVTDIMAEISAASAEQSTGVAQVGEAITQMDQATQQNAALVEEMAAAASSLKSQAQDLVEVVAVFKVTQAATPDKPQSNHPLRGSSQRASTPQRLTLGGAPFLAAS
jgi:methyl-accepting chemotaxis protein